VTPRKSARTHLPELDQSFPELQAKLGAKVETLTTPDGTWGTNPTADWLTLHALPWPKKWTPPKGRGRQ